MTTGTWQSVFRSLCLRYSTATLAALVLEIETGGKRLVHGKTTKPPPPMWFVPAPRCEGACLVGFLEATERTWTNEQGKPATSGDVEAWFARAVVGIGSSVWVPLGDLWDRQHDAAALVLAETRKVIEERLEAA